MDSKCEINTETGIVCDAKHIHFTRTQERVKWIILVYLFMCVGVDVVKLDSKIYSR